MEEIQGGHCPCSKIQGGQPTTLPRLAARLCILVGLRCHGYCSCDIMILLIMAVEVLWLWDCYYSACSGAVVVQVVFGYGAYGIVLEKHVMLHL